MDDWKDKIEGWQSRLADWQRAFDEHYATLARKRKGWFGKLSQGELDEIATEARGLAGEEVAVELYQFLSELCDGYLAEALPAPRAKVRAWIGNDPTTLGAAWSYAVQALEALRGDDAALQLRRGLAALSIVDLRVDFNQNQELLGRYWAAARKLGLDPQAELDALAKLSNQGMGGGGAELATVLREFGSSAYFRDRVRPLLPRISA